MCSYLTHLLRSLCPSFSPPPPNFSFSPFSSKPTMRTQHQLFRVLHRTQKISPPVFAPAPPPPNLTENISSASETSCSSSPLHFYSLSRHPQSQDTHPLNTPIVLNTLSSSIHVARSTSTNNLPRTHPFYLPTSSVLLLCMNTRRGKPQQLSNLCRPTFRALTKQFVEFDVPVLVFAVISEIIGRHSETSVFSISCKFLCSRLDILCSLYAPHLSARSWFSTSRNVPLSGYAVRFFLADGTKGSHYESERSAPGSRHGHTNNLLRELPQRFPTTQPLAHVSALRRLRLLLSVPLLQKIGTFRQRQFSVSAGSLGRRAPWPKPSMRASNARLSSSLF